MKISNISTIFKKEMTDTLRDRRTLIFMMLIPIIAIPLLMMVVSSLMVSQITKVQSETSDIIIRGTEFLPEELKQTIIDDSRLLLVDSTEIESESPFTALSEGEIDILIEIPPDFISLLSSERTAAATVYFDQAEMKSEFARDRIENIMEEYSLSLVESRVEDKGLNPEILAPYEINYENVAPPKKIIGKEFGAILPYIIIIMCFMGAMYPAIDLAAGEKERGTLETLLVSPATRSEFVIGKYMVILTTGIIAAILSLISLVYSMNYIVEDFVSAAGKMLQIEFNFPMLILIFLIILPLAGIFAGILLAVSSFARSFKEAQSYVTALNMLIILPAFVSLLPAVELNFKMALIPVINASLIIKEAISGNIAWDMVAVAFLANAVIAAAALIFCRKWFEKESVLFRM